MRRRNGPRGGGRQRGSVRTSAQTSRSVCARYRSAAAAAAAPLANRRRAFQVSARRTQESAAPQQRRRAPSSIAAALVALRCATLRKLGAEKRCRPLVWIDRHVLNGRRTESLFTFFTGAPLHHREQMPLFAPVRMLAIDSSHTQLAGWPAGAKVFCAHKTSCNSSSLQFYSFFGFWRQLQAPERERESRQTRTRPATRPRGAVRPPPATTCDATKTAAGRPICKPHAYVSNVAGHLLLCRCGAARRRASSEPLEQAAAL